MMNRPRKNRARANPLQFSRQLPDPWYSPFHFLPFESRASSCPPPPSQQLSKDARKCFIIQRFSFSVLHVYIYIQLELGDLPVRSTRRVSNCSEIIRHFYPNREREVRRITWWLFLFQPRRRQDVGKALRGAASQIFRVTAASPQFPFFFFHILFGYSCRFIYVLRARALRAPVKAESGSRCLWEKKMKRWNMGIDFEWVYK